MSFRIDVSEPVENVALLCFADPSRENQLCWAAVDELGQRMRESRERGARVIVLCSSLPGHWLQHAWLRDLEAGIAGRATTASGEGWFTVQQELTHDAVVSIAAINGDCSGGGAEFGWACDLRIAEEQVRFAQPEVNMGLTTGIGGCSRLMRIAGRTVTAEMVLGGRPLTARRLYEVGALNQLVETGAALSAALAMAKRIAQQSPEAVCGLKRILNAGQDMPLNDALRNEQEVFQSVAGTTAARAGMRAVQSAYDSGATIASANHYDD
ncbi:MAG: enoyl-CoA hydratase-related protein [Halioglobus sp.]